MQYQAFEFSFTFCKVCVPLSLSISFGRLCEMVDHVFPVLVLNEAADIPSSDSIPQTKDWRKELLDSHSLEEDEPIETQ